MDEAHAYRALCYVELQPRAGRDRQAQAWDYSWSSPPLHCDRVPSGSWEAAAGAALLDLAAWRAQMPPREWRDTLNQFARDKAAHEEIRRNTSTGRPLGSDRFLSKIEHLLGRRIRPLPVGRPKGWRKNKPDENSTQRKNKRKEKTNKR